MQPRSEQGAGYRVEARGLHQASSSLSSAYFWDILAGSAAHQSIRRAGQQVPGILLSLPASHWDHKCLPPYLAFLVSAENPNSVPRACTKSPYHPHHIPSHLLLYFYTADQAHKLLPTTHVLHPYPKPPLTTSHGPQPTKHYFFFFYSSTYSIVLEF